MTEDDPARVRFMLLNLVRVSGVVFAMLGITIIVKRWVEPAEVIGGALVIVGAIDVMVIPLILARRWRSPPGS